MGTTIEVVARDDAALGATEDLFRRHEFRFSRFLPDSELSRVNDADGDWVEVSAEMAAVLGIAEDLRGRTGGLVDPAVGSSVIAWGYDRTFGDVTGLQTEPQPLPQSEWSLEGRAVWRRPGTRLDLGGIAKGWTADVAVESGRAVLVSAGGDVRSAIESAIVEVSDPWGATPATVELGAGALATSSVSHRRWQAGTTDAHHLIDPRTGDPVVSPVLMASAICATAAEAEAAAKAVLITGTDGLAWADSQPWVEAAIVTWHDGSVFATTGWEVAA
jgi:thiamine biosynthesis lipoprotein